MKRTGEKKTAFWSGWRREVEVKRGVEESEEEDDETRPLLGVAVLKQVHDADGVKGTPAIVVSPPIIDAEREAVRGIDALRRLFVSRFFDFIFLFCLVLFGDGPEPLHNK
ncbi:hypothetical protein HDU67_004582 [Dinochytrium kinnereticum]|nr:hypothetical protein HDU67_004582 [Dinochytrium kinnereticum]